MGNDGSQSIPNLCDDATDLRGLKSRREREEALRGRSDEELRSRALLSDESPSPILRIAADGMVLYANRASAALEEPWVCVTGRPAPKPLADLVRRALDEGQTREKEIESAGRIFSFVLAPIRDGGYVNLYGRDVTLRKRVEHAVHESRAQLEAELADTQLLQVISAELVQEDNIRKIYQKIVEAAAQIMRSQCASMQMLCPGRAGGQELRLLAFRGLSPEAARFWERVDVDSAISIFGKAALSGQRVIVPDVEDCDFLRDTDDIAVFRQTGMRACQTTPLYSRRGKMVGMIATHWRRPHQPSERDWRLLDILTRQAADIIDHKQADEVRAEQSRLLDLSNDTIFVWNISKRITYWNRGAVETYGYTGDEALGKNPHDLLRTEFSEPIESIYKKLHEEGRWNGELVHSRKDGSKLVVMSRWALDRDSEGNPLAVLETNNDITERKRSEEALLAAKADAEAASLAKSRFLANMSHELRTPMNAILGMIDVALPKAQDPIVHDCLQTMKGSGDLLLTLLNDLLDSAKIESGRLELEAAPFSLRHMIDQLTRVLSARASEKGLAFFSRMPEATPDVVVGDRMRLQQILLNLAGNAIKFTEQGEVELDIRALSQDGEAVLEFAVRDTGIGIAAEDLKRLFRPFVQADVSTSRRFGGTGLGLSICKSLIEMMGGTIWAESELGQGSIFYFTMRLPLTNEQPAEWDGPAAFTAAAAKPLRVLLVEDNPANQKLARYILLDRGHHVDVAADGNEALVLIAEGPYDLVLMDVQMPGMNGLQATAAIRKRETRDSHVPIVAMTAHAMKEDRARCLAAGMNGYLSKPVNAREMICLIEKLAGRVSFAGAAETLAAADPIDSASQKQVAVFDRNEALRRCCDSHEVLRDMIEYFLADFDKLFSQTEAALDRGDLLAISELAHRLKGTLAYLGAERASEAAAQVERSCAVASGAAAEAIRTVRLLEHECQILKTAVSAYLSERSTQDVNATV
jgi:PAS domain S-box-containing protein